MGPEKSFADANLTDTDAERDVTIVWNLEVVSVP